MVSVEIKNVLYDVMIYLERARIHRVRPFVLAGTDNALNKTMHNAKHSNENNQYIEMRTPPYDHDSLIDTNKWDSAKIPILESVV